MEEAACGKGMSMDERDTRLDGWVLGAWDFLGGVSRMEHCMQPSLHQSAYQKQWHLHTKNGQLAA